MRKIVLFVVMAVILVFVSSAVLFAADEKEASAQEATGMVSFVDAQGGKLVVTTMEDGSVKDVIVVVGDTAVIEKDGSSVKLVDVANGDEVTVTYQADANGQNNALSVSVSASQ